MFFNPFLKQGSLQIQSRQEKHKRKIKSHWNRGIPAIKHSRVQELNHTNKHIFLSNERGKKRRKQEKIPLGSASHWLLSQFLPVQGREHPGFGWIGNFLRSIQFSFFLSIPWCCSGNDTGEFRNWNSTNSGLHHWKFQSILGFPQNMKLRVSKPRFFQNIIFQEGAGLPKPQLSWF